jgi:hypothetical protein
LENDSKTAENRREKVDKTRLKNFTFYLTHPVTVNTSSVTYLTQLVAAENVEVVKHNDGTTYVFMLL